jgi:hypothetical protein
LEGVFFERKGRLVERAQLGRECFEDSESEDDYELGILGGKVQSRSTLDDEDKEEHDYYESEDGEREMAGLACFPEHREYQRTAIKAKERLWDRR